MPDWAPLLRARLASLELTPERELEIVEELSLHLEERFRELVAGGMSTGDAERVTFAELHGAGLLAPRLASLAQAGRARSRPIAQCELLASRTFRRWSMTEIIHDARYALRGLRAAPVFAMTAILTLALGIGANTAIFSLVHGVLLRPLPFPDPDRLYAVYSANRTADLLRAPVSAVDLDDWRSQRASIEDVGGYFYAEGSSGVDLTGRGSPRRLAAVFITPGFLTTLGVPMERGRVPREDELTRGGKDAIVLLTHGFWLREFGGAETVVGSPLTLNGRPYDVVGVLPPEMRFPAGEIDVMIPYSTIPDSSIPRLRQVRVLNVVARAKPGVGEDAVRAEMLAITGRLAKEYPQDRSWDAATVVPLADVISGPVHDGLLVLFGAVGFVLLMACVNVTNLQLARVVGRGREIAVRLALGAGRARLAQLFLIESIVVSAIGGAVGFGLATVGVRGLIALAGGQLPRAAEVTLDGTVMGFAVAVTFVVGVAVAIVPIWRAVRGDLSSVLRDGGRSVAGGGHTRVRRALVVAEVAVAIMLVIGAGLMSRSFLALLAVDAGFRADHLLAVQFTIDPQRHAPPAPPASGGGNPAPPAAGSPYLAYYSEVIERVRRLPGVVSAAAVKDPPLRGNGERNGFRIPGRPVPAGQDPPSATVIHVSDGYFSTIGAHVDGREYAATDRAGAPFVVVVNEAFARQYFPGERPVGKRLEFGSNISAEIIGVVDDIRQAALAEPAQPTVYLHNLQNSRVKTTIVARTVGDPLGMAEAIRQTIWSIDPDQAITAVFTFDEAVSRAMARPRLLTVLLGAFGILGLGLGAIGLYGTLAALVGERRREIGVRLALGAEPRQVLTMVIRGGLGLAAVGVVIGLAGAAGLSQFLTSVLYGVTPADPVTFAATAGIFVLTAAAASWLPARRAARLDPVETLRAE
jgi:predicted permease